MEEKEALLTTRVDKPTELKNLLSSGKILPAPGAFNAICAKIIEDAGFPAVYVSGAGVNNGLTGYPDIGMVTLTEMVQQAGYIAQSVNVPVISDADTGFGEAINVFRTVKEFERAGICGIHLEDQVFPKRCGHLSGKQVISSEEMANKIAAAVKARYNPDFLIIARTDAKAVHGFDDAVNRAIRYLDAGADMIFPEAMESAEDFRFFAERVRAKHPKAMLMANMTEFGKTPYLSLNEFQELGYQLVIYPMTAFRVMMKAVQEAMVELKKQGTQQHLLEKMTTRKDLYELIHYPAYEGLDSTLAAQYN